MLKHINLTLKVVFGESMTMTVDRVLSDMTDEELHSVIFHVMNNPSQLEQDIVSSLGRKYEADCE